MTPKEHCCLGARGLDLGELRTCSNFRDYLYHRIHRIGFPGKDPKQIGPGGIEG